jgi:hypothetical protein
LIQSLGKKSPRALVKGTKAQREPRGPSKELGVSLKSLALLSLGQILNPTIFGT